MAIALYPKHTVVVEIVATTIARLEAPGAKNFTPHDKANVIIDTLRRYGWLGVETFEGDN